MSKGSRNRLGWEIPAQKDYGPNSSAYYGATPFVFELVRGTNSLYSCRGLFVEDGWSVRFSGRDCSLLKPLNIFKMIN